MSSYPQSQTTETIEKHIKRAWIAAVVSASMTLLLVLLSIGGIQIIPGLDVWAIIDAAIIAGFAFGIYRRSRVCAFLLLVYAVFNEVYMISDGNKPSPLRIIFIYYYFRGFLAAIAYHKLNPRRPAPSLAPATPVSQPPPLPKCNGWFVCLEEQVRGPFSIEQLNALLDVGTIRQDTQCCPEGTQEWQPLSAVIP